MKLLSQTKAGIHTCAVLVPNFELIDITAGLLSTGLTPPVWRVYWVPRELYAVYCMPIDKANRLTARFCVKGSLWPWMTEGGMDENSISSTSCGRLKLLTPADECTQLRQFTNHDKRLPSAQVHNIPNQNNNATNSRLPIASTPPWRTRSSMALQLSFQVPSGALWQSDPKQSG